MDQLFKTDKWGCIAILIVGVAVVSTILFFVAWAITWAIT
jgi:hypothetical protein